MYGAEGATAPSLLVKSCLAGKERCWDGGLQASTSPAVHTQAVLPVQQGWEVSGLVSCSKLSSNERGAQLALLCSWRLSEKKGAEAQLAQVAA